MSMLLLFIAVLLVGDVYPLEWCEYFLLIGKTRPECRDENSMLVRNSLTTGPNGRASGSIGDVLRAVAATSHKLLPSLIKRVQDLDLETALAPMPVEEEFEEGSQDLEMRHLFKMAICNGPTYEGCEPDLDCKSEVSCELPSGARCCLAQRRNIQAPRIFTECPSTRSMNIECNVEKPTSWCNSDSECSKTPVRMCCPTGCGYNICIQSQGYVIDNGVTVIDNPHCPPPPAIEVRCGKGRSTNWCNGDDECELNNVPRGLRRLTRHCCPTICNYNACVVNYGGRFVIG